MKKKKTWWPCRFRKQTVPELFGVRQREYKGARRDTNAKDWKYEMRIEGEIKQLYKSARPKNGRLVFTR